MSLYMLRPISDRTGFTGRHIRSPFSATWTATRYTLGFELRELKAQNAVVEIDVRERDIRIDGENRNGGNRGQWDLVEQAIRVLEHSS